MPYHALNVRWPRGAAGAPQQLPAAHHYDTIIINNTIITNGIIFA